MPNLSIKNVPADVVAKLRERAAAHHRSLQGELMALVTAVAGEAPATTEQARGGSAATATSRSSRSQPSTANASSGRPARAGAPWT
jgi:plasmid stability protein